jgi:hypothetical protein
LACALRDAGSTDRAAVRNALAQLNVTTFFGEIRFDERGVNVYKPMVVNQVQSGKLVTIYPYQLAMAERTFELRGSPTAVSTRLRVIEQEARRGWAGAVQSLLPARYRPERSLAAHRPPAEHEGIVARSLISRAFNIVPLL